MKRWLLRIAVALTGLVTVACVGAWLLLRGSVPGIDGSVRVAGLSAEVAISRDAEGIPTIEAGNRRDLAFATGFAHGQDRFFQMDLIRRQAAGELSELFGAAALDTDKRYRWHRFRSRAREVLEREPAARIDLLRAYTAGVNAGLESLDVRPFEYLLLRAEPEHWQPEDSLLVVYAMFVTLNDERARRDVRRGLAAGALPPQVFDWLYPQGSPWDAPVEGEVREVNPLPPETLLSLRDIPVSALGSNEQGPSPLEGSNNWAVAGWLTDDGRALVSNDMHLAHGVPNLWYQARLVVSGPEPVELSGVTLPGTPFLVTGSNGRIAWGFTNSYGDWSDAVVLDVDASGERYRTPDGMEPFRRYVERIDVRDADPVDYEILETRWGPVDDRTDFDGSPVAVAWLGHRPRAINLSLLSLETLASVDAALDAASRSGIPPQNFVVGDEQGNIGWTIAGQIPVRDGYDPGLPADWSRAGGWTGWRRPEEYPRIVNPPSGRIWTANTRVVDGEALAIIGDGGYDLGARAKQIRDALMDKDSFTAADMLAIQRDDRALFLAPWRDLLLRVLDGAATSPPADYRRAVEEWIPRAAPDSVGYRLVRAFRLELRHMLFSALSAPIRERYGDAPRLRVSNQFENPLWQLVSEQPQHLLPAGYESWNALLLDAAMRSYSALTGDGETELSARSWGSLNRARIRHPLSRAVPQLSSWLDMPADPLHGDANMPLVQWPGFGASERFSVSPGAEARGLMHMPGGQSGHPLSPFFGAGHDDWVLGRPSPFLPGEPAHRLTLLPERP